MIKKITVLFVVLCITAVAYAQKNLAKGLADMFSAKALPTASVQVERQLARSAVLSRQVERTYLRALQTNKLLSAPLSQNALPYATIQISPQLQGKILYPNLNFLDTPEQVADYLVIRNNLLYMQEVKHLEKWQQKIEKLYPSMRKEAYSISQPLKGREVGYIVNRVPADVTDIFIGEEHFYYKIQDTVSELISQLKQSHANQEVFLFTEFLPENIQWTHDIAKQDLPEYLQNDTYIRVFQEATDQGIHVIGLEPEFMVNNSCTIWQQAGTEKFSQLVSQSLWESYEGMRLRNQAWLKILAQYRAAHPQALFIVYSGIGHALYHWQFSLPRYFEKRFVISVSSGENVISNFYEKANLPQRVIVWKNPELAKVAGYDAHILVK